MSQWLVFALTMAVACLIVLGVVVIRDRHSSAVSNPDETPDVIEYMTMMVGVVYAIVLGLAIAGVWEARNAADGAVCQEAQALHEVRERVAVWPAPVRDRIRDDVDHYVQYVTTTEWPSMLRTGTLSSQGATLLETMRRDVSDYTTANDHEQQAYQPLVDQVAAVDAARSAREQAAAPILPGVVWLGLITGAVITVGLIFTLQIRRSPRELLVAGVFSALIAFLLCFIWDFDAPYGRVATGTVSAFAQLIAAAHGG
ncbi:MAG: DUF4239 domain-containing protein [Streptomycetaceae bacterium]|nr:DUF4239 domain-containing protein [Streptomycetaceae bacterium]